MEKMILLKVEVIFVENKLEYLGIYDEEFVQLYTVKILAQDQETAEKKFKNYLRQQNVSYILEHMLHIIPLFAVDTIE